MCLRSHDSNGRSKVKDGISDLSTPPRLVSLSAGGFQLPVHTVFPEGHGSQLAGGAGPCAPCSSCTT